MSRKVCSEVSSISTLIDRQVDRQAPDGETFETLTREDTKLLPPNVDVEYDVSLSTKVTTEEKTPRADIRNGTRYCNGKVTATTHRGEPIA